MNSHLSLWKVLRDQSDTAWLTTYTPEAVSLAHRRFWKIAASAIAALILFVALILTDAIRENFHFISDSISSIIFLLFLSSVFLILFSTFAFIFVLSRIEYVRDAEFHRILDEEDQELIELLTPISKEQGFLMYGQLYAARSKAIDIEIQVKRDRLNRIWGIK